MTSECMGKKQWLVPDCELPPEGEGLLKGHESVIVVNDSGEDAEIEVKIAVGDNRRELIEQYVNVEHLTREMVEILIDKITVGKRIPGTRNVPIEIHWNF